MFMNLEHTPEIVQGDLPRMSSDELRFLLHSLLQLAFAKEKTGVLDAATLLDQDKALLKREIDESGGLFRKWLSSENGSKAVEEYLGSYSQKDIESGKDFETILSVFQSETAH
jgi:hypothetical protein